MKWREDFLSQRKDWCIEDLRKETEMKITQAQLSRELRLQSLRNKHKRIKKEVQDFLKKNV